MSSIPDDVRYRVFDYLWHSKGVGSWDLGVRPYRANKIKNRRRRVSDDLLRRTLEMLSPEEYAELVEGVTLVRVDPNTFVETLASAVSDPVLKPILVEFVRN